MAETYRHRPSRSPRLRVWLPPPDEGDAGAPPTGKPVETRRRRRLPPEVLSDAEVRALMDACGRYALLALRNRALIALLYRTGLRMNEALGLYPKDIDLADGSVRVLRGKGGRSRTVGLDHGAAAVLQPWFGTPST